MRLPEYSLRITEPPYGTSIPQDTIIEIRWRYEGEDTFPKVQWGLKRWEARRIEYNVTSIPSNERKWKLAFTGLTNYETQVGIIGGKAGILEKGAEYNYNHTTYAHPEPEIIGVAGQVIKLTIALKKERI
jgi:hypothetical protein